MTRVIRHRYADPIEVVWVTTAERLGLRVVRSSEVYASWDGRGTLAVSSPEHLDPDDSMAQLVLHELCHALVQGPDRHGDVDWGLDPDDAVREHACHRLQAALADRYGLRAFFAVTTDWRPYWDALPADPLADEGDPAVPLARAAYTRATTGPWAGAIAAALAATRALADVTRPFAGDDSLWRADGR